MSNKQLHTAFKRKYNCDCSIRVIVLLLLEWLTALLEYLDLVLHYKH